MKRLLTSRFYRRYFNAVSPQWDWLAWIPCQHRITMLEQLMQWQTPTMTDEQYHSHT
ncbi:glucose uptake inhibitor SgrT [Chimaeribacter californicus]|uniref:Glucose uptake inhibitor SgrT n=1 Tax=Chimaeribacter californicus TaxID=2060067 RepID=A0A2N5EEW3_9GAMM|nr:glucose uptake inhibitor SgrT [Chimaeribacter californicus]PLR41047.1 glucose uptake inhibitor SgrT [Chimaeribacter californicus]